MKLGYDVKKMTFGQRGQEIMRLHRRLKKLEHAYGMGKRWAKATNNFRCHDADDELARVFGSRKRGRVRLCALDFLGNCLGYVRREVRTGRMKK